MYDKTNTRIYASPVGKQTRKFGHGGARPGAGRKPTMDDAMMVSFRMARADYEKIEALAKDAGASVSEYFRRIAKRHLASKRSRS